MIDEIQRIDQTEKIEIRILEQGRNDCYIFASHRLMRHQHPSHPVLMSNANLCCRSQRNSPCSGLQLAMEQLRSHRRFAVRRKFHAVCGRESLHPLLIVLQFVVIKNRRGQAYILTQEIPAQARDVARSQSLPDGTETL